LLVITGEGIANHGGCGLKMKNMKTETTKQDEIRTSVRERYGRIAVEESGCGCAPTCCAPSGGEAVAGQRDATAISRELGYTADQTNAVPQGANLGLGCGNPLAIAGLKRGQRVLDLGSGAGIDTFLAARAVGTGGFVVGVDMTPEMLAKARKNQQRAGYQNVEFRLGEIENLPVADDFADVIISNCVINLSPDKPRVLREAFRALKPGGALAISDIVALKPLPTDMRGDWELYAGCVAGASTLDELGGWLALAGFEKIRIAPKPGSREIIREWFPGRGTEDYVASATIEAVKPMS
jgi:arsenite methyltransferase